ncbi:hypothetical protein ACQP2E_12130 [Actinoplanes sp. CA-015351]|uniref:hypothetical protein n=1 Tax=Actinoplanes sp. CA-015351 TaxID=3239897 RepID=UPI003D991F47
MSTSLYAAELPPPLAGDVDQCWRRLQRFLDEGESRVITGVQARAVAERLWRRISEHPYGARPEADPRVSAALATLYWFRVRAAGTSGDVEEQRSLALFRCLARLGDGKVVPPGPRRRLDEEDEENGQAEQLNDIAVQLLAEYAANRSRGALQESISVLRQAAGHAKPGTPVLARLQTNLAGALLTLYKTEQRRDIIRDALTSGGRAVANELTFGVDRAAALSNYATVLVFAAGVPGLVERPALRAAVDHARGARRSLGPASPLDSSYTDTVISVARVVFERTGEWHDLQVALALAEQRRPRWV